MKKYRPYLILALCTILAVCLFESEAGPPVPPPGSLFVSSTTNDTMDADLTVTGTVTADSFTASASNNPVLTLDETDGTDWQVRNDDAGNQLEFGSSQAGIGDNVEFVIDEDGDVHATGDVTGGILTISKSANYTIGTDNARESYGGIIYVTSACTITAAAVADGMHFGIITVGAIAVSLDVNASDLMYLDGTALDDGDKATNTSTAGDFIFCTYYDATGLQCLSGSNDGDKWTDGGA